MNISCEDYFIKQKNKIFARLKNQQLRLRHISYISALNVPTKDDHLYYFTLHFTALGAPFYTSEMISPALFLRWSPISHKEHMNSLPAVVLRIWEHDKSNRPGYEDSVLTTWGVNLSGLYLIGFKVAELAPKNFIQNTVIFCIRGSYYTARSCLKQASDSVKVLEESTVCSKSSLKSTYNIEKLRNLHSLQLSIRNTVARVNEIRDKLRLESFECPTNVELDTPAIEQTETRYGSFYEPQLLTMTSLNKIIHPKKTHAEKGTVLRLQKNLEDLRLIIGICTEQRIVVTDKLKELQKQCSILTCSNKERNANLTKDRQTMASELCSLRIITEQNTEAKTRYFNLYLQLQHRRKKLLKELLFIYPIEEVAPQKYTINGIFLPNSDMMDDGDLRISVALGYVAHIVLMSSAFLQVPLRYNLVYQGSRSTIIDHISPTLQDKDREFPLFTKGQEKIHFMYGVYLLNRNIAQLRWSLMLQTLSLKPMLANLLTFLDTSKELKSQEYLDDTRLMQLSTISIANPSPQRIGGDSSSAGTSIDDCKCCDNVKKIGIRDSYETGEHKVFALEKWQNLLIAAESWMEMGLNVSAPQETTFLHS